MRFNWEPGLEFDGIEDSVYFVLGDAYVGLCDLNACVIENLVKKNQTLCAAVVLLIYISSECLSECMSRKVIDVNFVFPLEIFESFIDVLDGE